VLAGDVHPQDSGPNAKVQRRIQDERFAIDAGGDGAVRIDLESRGGPFAQRALRRTAVLAATGGRTEDNDPEQAIVDARAGAGADCVAESVLVVGDQHYSAGVMFVSPRPGPAHIDVAAAGAHHVRHGVQQGADLGVAVAGALDRLGVEAEGDIVDEYATVDLGEVHPTLTAINERVERTGDVVAVNAEIEREVVAGAGGHACVGQPALGGTLATIACEPSPPAMASPSAPRSTAPRTSTSRSSPGFSSIGSIPRSRASLASWKRSAFPPPERGLKKSTGCRGAVALGKSTWMVKAALAAASDTRRPATINRSTNRAPPTTIKATAPTSAMPATITPTTRAMPRRRKPYQAEAPATSTQPNRARPRGNWFIATAMASASVAAATTSAKIAVSRLIAFDLRGQRCQLRCDCPHPTPRAVRRDELPRIRFSSS
jgi:hypothetical protein